MNVAELWEGHWAPYGEKARPSWRSTQATHWPHLKPHFGPIAVAKLTELHVDDYRAMRACELTARGSTVTAASRNREVSSLTAMLKWAAKPTRKLIPLHPLRGLGGETEVPGRVRAYLPEDGLHRILSFLAAQGRWVEHDSVLFLYDTGLRPGELLSLRQRNLSIGAHWSVSVEGTKNGDDRTVPLTGRARQALANQMARNQTWIFAVGETVLGDWFRAARAAAGLPDTVVLYSCRHSYATNLRRRGVDWLLTKRLMGHRSDKAAQKYQHVDTVEHAGALAKMETGIAAEGIPLIAATLS